MQRLYFLCSRLSNDQVFTIRRVLMFEEIVVLKTLFCNLDYGWTATLSVKFGNPNFILNRPIARFILFQTVFAVDLSSYDCKSLISCIMKMYSALGIKNDLY